MEAAEQAEGAESPAQPRPKRSRTGCLTCRTRRRKCDEGKPKCQNCISKGFECRYGAAFQILGKNNFTPEVATNVKYTNLRFVSEGDEKRTDDHEEAGAVRAGRVDESLSIAQNSPSNLLQGPIEQLEDRPTEDALPEDTSPSVDSYEFALHGLLALGSGNVGGADTSVSRPSGVSVSENEVAKEPLRQLSSNSNLESTLDDDAAERPAKSQELQNWPLVGATDDINFIQLPQELILNLLKHYRYQIAPWLDICDKNQFFGCEMMHLSTESTSIRYGLLAIAEASLNARHEAQTSNIALLADICRERNRGQDAVYSSLLEVLIVVRNAIMDISGFWLREADTPFRRGILDALLPEVSTGSSISTSTYWLLVRLELSFALMSSFPPRIPLPFMPILDAQHFTTTSMDATFKCAHEAVALCVDAAMFCQEDEDRWLQQRYGLNRAEIWKALVGGFEQWYTRRPQDFQPAVEIYPRDGRHSEDEFPVIVFTGGVSILANQLYHTGMLLLLQNKPRFADRTNPNSPSMSTLWHTHRICGIALNNDRQECWDPCLVASLLVAARTVTHPSQHTAITVTLEGLQRLTGWNISHHIQILRDEWRMAEGW